MKLAEHYLFESRGKKFVLLPDAMQVHCVDPQDFRFIESLSDLAGCDDVVDDSDCLGRYGLKSIEDGSVLEAVSGTVSISKIAIFVAQDCNLNCTYCYGAEDGSSVGGTYGSRGKMALTTAISSVDWLLKNSGDRENVGIVFFGGEPLLNFPLMKEIVEYADKKADAVGKTMTYSITTNGSLLDAEKIEFLRKNRVNVTVSMDGGKRIQDSQRPLPGGGGSYDLVATKVKELLKVIPDADCRGTIINDADVEEAEKDLRDIGFKKIHLTVASKSLIRDDASKYGDPTGEDTRFHHTAETIRSEALKLVNAIRAKDVDLVNQAIMHTAWGKKLSRYSEQFINRRKTHFPCGAGRHYVGVSASGEIFPCHRFVGANDTKLGSVFNDDIDRSAYHKTTVHHDNPNSCSTCFAKYVCSGGCHHDNMGFSGDIHGPDPQMCDAIRVIVQEAAAIAAELSDEDRDFMRKSGFYQEYVCPLDIFA